MHHIFSAIGISLVSFSLASASASAASKFVASPVIGRQISVSASKLLPTDTPGVQRRLLVDIDAVIDLTDNTLAPAKVSIHEDLVMGGCLCHRDRLES